MAQVSPFVQHLLDKTSEANYGLWNALLTINGIMVSAFSLTLALTTRINRTTAMFLVGSCMVSILLILWNYLTTKWHYLNIGRRLGSGDFELTEAQRRTDLKQSNKQHMYLLYREYITLLLLLFEMILIGIIVFSMN